MAAEVKTQAELLADFADNTRGVITPEDLRSLTLTLFDRVTDSGAGREHVDFISRTVPGATAPSKVAVGPAIGLAFDVGDACKPHLSLPLRFDAGEDVTVKIKWTPDVSAASKKVSWELDYLVVQDGKAINAVDDTLSSADNDVPATAYESAETVFTIPAAAFEDADFLVHMELRRVAASSDEAGTIVAHDVFAEFATA